MPNAYNPVGALGGLFAPAFIYGNPQSDAAVSAWGKANLKSPPPPVPVAPPVAPPSTGTGTRGIMGSPGFLRGGLDLASGLNAGSQRDAIAAAMLQQQQADAAGGLIDRTNPFAGRLATEVGGGG